MPCVRPNPDISGIGVRVSIYCQAFLQIVCIVNLARDGIITKSERAALVRNSVQLFITGFALLMAAFIQAREDKVSVYHALIVLNLGWIIAMSAGSLVVIKFADDAGNAAVLTGSRRRRSKFFEWVRKGLVWLSRKWRRVWGYDEMKFREALQWVVLPIIYLCGMGAFGIFLWSKLDTFGGQDKKCTSELSTSLFGHNIPVVHQSLRIISLVLYSLLAIPIVNLFLMVVLVTLVLSLALFVVRIASYLKARSVVFTALLLIFVLTIAAALELLFVVDTELMIFHSTRLVESGESEWSFGQCLAVLMVIIPLIDAVKLVYDSYMHKA